MFATAAGQRQAGQSERGAAAGGQAARVHLPGAPELGKPGCRESERRGQLLWCRAWPGLGLGQEAGR